MKTIRFFTLGLVLCWLGTVSLQAADWAEFRGSNHGHAEAKSLPLKWSATENVKWKIEVPGTGWSSPALFKDRIYLTSAITNDAGGQSLHALCVDAKDGKIVWNTEVFRPQTSPGIHKKNSHASPTAVIEKDRVYVHFGHQGTACLDLKGKVIWKNDTIKYQPVHGNGGSPVIVDDILFFSCDGAKDPFMVALDKQSGSIRWKVPRETTAKRAFSFSTATVITVNGQKQIISPGSGVVCALNPKDGKELWRCRYGEGYSVIPKPVYANGMLFLSSGYDRPIAMAIRVDANKGDVTDTHVAWSLPKGGPNTPSMLVVGDEFYMVSDGGIATCADAKTGSVHWQERIGGNYSASPIYAAGRIYFQSEQGMGVVLKPGKTFEKLAENNLAERTLASYAVGNKCLFIRGEQHLFRIE
ncbi:MAG TPA: PQQ-binding-like beta-propeller repeat protein [Verrucomicrobiae bacterium]